MTGSGEGAVKLADDRWTPYVPTALADSHRQYKIVPLPGAFMFLTGTDLDIVRAQSCCWRWRAWCEPKHKVTVDGDERDEHAEC